MTALTDTRSQIPELTSYGGTPEEREEFLQKVIRRYEGLADTQTDAAVALRHAFLQALKDAPSLVHQAPYSRFLAHTVEPEDFASIEWDTPSHMLRFCESLYKYRFEDEQLAHQLKEHASALLRQALYQYEKEGEMEKLFRLLRLTPSYLLRQDPELSRLHYRANAYEVRRVRRNRRWLYAYLVIQVLLVIFIFPLLFINAENGRLQRQVEQLADVELGDEGYKLIPYSEGLYWAIITASSIGYGDVTPKTTTGRIIAATLGPMGVITVGILAGLILDWITPRRLE